MSFESLPPTFVTNVVSFFPNGRQWLADLPQRLTTLAGHWHLHDIRPVASLSFNFVARATQHSGHEVVLKVSPDPSIVAAEATWLRHHAGKPVVGVLAVTDDAYLMECLSPGLSLKPASLPEDRDAARTIAHLINDLSRNPPPTGAGDLFRPVAGDASGFDDYRHLFGTAGPSRCQPSGCRRNRLVGTVGIRIAAKPRPRRLPPRQCPHLRKRRGRPCLAANRNRPARIGRRNRIRMRRNAPKSAQLVPKRTSARPHGIRPSIDPRRNPVP